MYFSDVDGQSVKTLSSSTRKPARIVAVAQAKLTFMKPTQTGMYSYIRIICVLFLSGIFA